VKIRGHEEGIGKLVARLIRLIGWTLRIRVEDRARLLDRDFTQPMIWTFWHNRMFVLPLLRDRYARHRTGAVLTSASEDGEIIAAVMNRFGLKSVRGSSSRRGTTALLALTGTLEAGEDVAVTPDGPRGPRYKLGPGVVFLAQQTGAAILPIHIEYSRAVRLKSWDRFMIPLPFAQVRIVCDELIFAARDADTEAERARIEQLMQPKTE
jgi:Kdo2-lipid IVA 3' secondary acyltransferase